MKIEFNTNHAIEFIDVEQGAVFLDPRDDSLHMKTESIECGDCDEINAVNLADGVIDAYPDDAKVWLVNAVLNINQE